MARTSEFNKEAVNYFFDILENIVKLNEIDTNAIFNMNVSEFSTVQKKCGKIVTEKAKRIGSGERGIHTTIVCWIFCSSYVHF